MSYPTTPNGDVEDEEEGAMGNRVPHIVVVDSRAGDLLELLAIHIPGNALRFPASRGAVDDDAPGVPALVRDPDAVSQPVVLVANTSRAHVAVERTVAGQLSVDGLEDVNLAALGPRGTLTDAIAEEPEGGPYALLITDAVAAEPDLCLQQRSLSRGRRQDIRALETARGPAARHGRVTPRHDLQGSAAALLYILDAVAVGLQLAVHTKVASNDVPVGCVGGGAARAGESIRPDQVVTAVAGRGPSRDGNGPQKEREERGCESWELHGAGTAMFLLQKERRG